MADGRIEVDPLFQGLTRPAVILGVTYTYFLINLTLTMCYYIWTSSFMALFVAAPAIHMFGYWLCLKEPRVIEILQTRSSECIKTKFPNWLYHQQTHSYDIF